MIQGNSKKKDRYEIANKSMSVGHVSLGKPIIIPPGERKNPLGKEKTQEPCAEMGEILIGKTPYINEKKESGGIKQMALADAFSKEDRVEVKFSDFYKLMREGAKAELITNAVNCDVPHQYIRQMLTGEPGIKEEAEYFTAADIIKSSPAAAERR